MGLPPSCGGSGIGTVRVTQPDGQLLDVGIYSSTKVMGATGEGYSELTIEDLRNGDVVQVWGSGISESYPGKMHATDLIRSEK